VVVYSLRCFWRLVACMMPARAIGPRRPLHAPRYLALALACIAALAVSACASGPAATTDVSGTALVAGSTALQPLVTAAAKLFMQDHSNAHLTVNGGGSLYGLQAVTSQRADVGDSDVYADPAQYPDPNLTDHLVCVIPFAMIANPDVTLSSLTQDQIVGIFSTGAYTNWKQLGGPDLPIVPIVRPATSGTRATFRKYILAGRDQNGKLLTSDSSQTVRDTVASTPGAIGYLAVSVLDATVHVIAIGGYAPTPANIEQGRYAFWGFEHMYTLGESSTLVTAFLDFMLTPAVQQIAQQLGYIPIAAMQLPSLAQVSPERMRV
jgi:phosphate transport system substrate-binding protein